MFFFWYVRKYYSFNIFFLKEKKKEKTKGYVKSPYQQYQNPINVRYVSKK